ncbi:MAG: patatin-like phospholipase family protein [Bacteroidota bacterium]
MPSSQIAPKNKKLVRVLSVDGGGIRGILPGQVLAALERKLQHKTGDKTVKVGDYFDFMAGTSTGGILTCALMTPDPENPEKLKYSAKDAVEIYLENGGKIFATSTFRNIRTGGGLVEEKFESDPIERILKEYFGDTKLSQLNHPCLISSYDVERGKPHFFTQHKAKEFAAMDNHGYDFLVRDVARATSAAPTYFEAANFHSLSGVGYTLVDGGIFANNPTLCAYSSVRQIDFGEEKTFPNAAEMLIFSLGTGSSPKSYDFDTVKSWGALGWIKPLINIMMDGVSKTVHYQLMQIFDAVQQSENYLRIEPMLGDAESDMDNAKPDNLLHLREAGIETAEKYDWELERLADKLIENA